jgi:hypothetical protein
MDGGRQLRRHRLIFFAVHLGVPAIALVAYVAASMASLSSFGS